MIPQGYKQTEIGVIPEEWEIVSLLSKCTLLNGLTYTPNDISDNGLLVIRSSNVQNNQLVFSDNVYVDLTVADEKLIKKDDIIICVRNGSAALIGKCAKASRDYAITFGAFMAVLRGDNNGYIYQLLQQGTIQKHTSKNSGATINQITNADFKTIYIPFPTHAKEQERIAEALSDVDSMISSLEKLIAKEKAIKQGAMQELLTGKKRLPGFTGEWKNCVIGDMGDFYSGLSGKSKKDFDCGDAHFITFLNVLLNVKIDTSILASVNVKENESQNAVQKGDLFFNTSSETPEEVGMCAVLDEELENTYLNSFCFGFRLNDDAHNPLFLSYYLNSSIGRKIMSVLAQGATRYNLSKNNFSETIIKLPIKEEQTAIASILSDMDNEIEALEQKLAKTRQIKQGMMQQLLTGKIRLM